MDTVEISSFLAGLPEHTAGRSLVCGDCKIVTGLGCVELVVV